MCVSSTAGHHLRFGWCCTDPYLHLLEHRVVLDPREQDPHGIGTVVQEGDPSSVQLLGQLVDVGLKLGESWMVKRETFKER